MTIQDLKIICNLLSRCKWVVARSLDVNTGDYQLKIEKSILTVAQSVRNLFYSGEGLTLETWAVSRSPSRAEWYTLLNFQLITIQCWTNIYGCARPLICIWTVIYNLQDFQILNCQWTLKCILIVIYLQLLEEVYFLVMIRKLIRAVQKQKDKHRTSYPDLASSLPRSSRVRGRFVHSKII